jgi:hypothetical protein
MRALRGPRRGVLAAVASALVALALVLGPATLDGTRAAFSATTANAGDQLATAQLQPPSGLTVTQSCTAAPAITHRMPTGAQGTTTVTLPVPPGTAAGDLLVAQIVYRDGAETLTVPTGWTPLTEASNGIEITSALYWKVAVAGEPAPVFSRPLAAPGVMAGGLVAYVGVRTTAPVVVFGNATGIGTTATTPSLATTDTTVEVVHLLTKSQEALPTPAGTTVLISGTTGIAPASLGVVAADETFAGPGSTPARSATSTTALSSEWIAQTVVLRRARDIPWATVSWTASPTSWAGGYVVTREVGGTVRGTQTVSGVATTSATHGPLLNGTNYTIRLVTSKGTWRSSSVTGALTPSC